MREPYPYADGWVAPVPRLIQNISNQWPEEKFVPLLAEHLGSPGEAEQHYLRAVTALSNLSGELARRANSISIKPSDFIALLGSIDRAAASMQADLEVLFSAANSYGRSDKVNAITAAIHALDDHCPDWFWFQDLTRSAPEKNGELLLRLEALRKGIAVAQAAFSKADISRARDVTYAGLRHCVADLSAVWLEAKHRKAVARGGVVEPPFVRFVQAVIVAAGFRKPSRSQIHTALD